MEERCGGRSRRLKIGDIQKLTQPIDATLGVFSEKEIARRCHYRAIVSFRLALTAPRIFVYCSCRTYLYEFY